VCAPIKRCKECGELKSPTDFPKLYKSKTGGTTNCCKACTQKKKKVWDKDRITRRGQVDASVVEKVCSKCNITKPIQDFPRGAVTKDGYSTFCRECHRIKKAVHKYGEEALPLLLVHTHLCGICGAVLEGAERNIDHDHKTGQIRGVLCHHCNIGLGSFKDDPLLLDKAISYIRNPPFSGGIPK
jgi:hypothetical protein